MPIISKINTHRLKKNITGIETATPSIEYLQGLIESLEEAFIGDFEFVATNYIRANQSFENMFWDAFNTIDKTDPSYTDKVNTSTYKMIPGNGGEWRSKQWNADSTVTVIKMNWRSGADAGSFDHDIEVSADNGANWVTVSSAGDEANMDKEIIISNPGTQVIVRVRGGTNGYLERYILLVK